MAKFKCIKVGCENFNKEIIHVKVKWKFCNESKKLKPDPSIMCDACGETVIFIKEDKGMCTNIGKFNSMDDKQKKEVLKKRAATHNKNRQRDEKEHYKRQAIKNYFNDGK